MKKQQAVIIYENTVPGLFVRRQNRFAAEVLVEGRRETVHVKNTGRLGELLVPGAAITLQRSLNPARKTAYDLISVYEPDLRWVNIDSLAPNALMKQVLNGEDFDLVRPEFTYGSSRFDFYMERGGKSSLLRSRAVRLRRI